MLRQIWTDFIALFFRRPARAQVAALCWRKGAAGFDVLLITSRGTKRWVLPKGWPKLGRSLAQSAEEEAWEEAGVRPLRPASAAIGRYRAEKTLAGDLPVTTFVDVFALQVAELAEDYPEKGQRQRLWFPFEKAASLVIEPGLARILRQAPQYLARQSWPQTSP